MSAPRPADETTRLQPSARTASNAQRQFEADLALFCLAVGGAPGAALLDGLARHERLRAREVARRLQGLDSSSRQARVARTFGVRDGAPDRLRALFVAAGPALQRQMFRLLPPYLKTTFPNLAGVTTQELEAGCPVRGPLAERLVREATR